MDPQLVQGLREAKELLDEGILTQAEFQQQKQLLFDKYAHASTLCTAEQPAVRRSVVDAGETDAVVHREQAAAGQRHQQFRVYLTM